jgi:hypothetical protein
MDEEWVDIVGEDLKIKLKQNPELFGDAYHFVVKTFYPYLVER